MPPKNTKGIFRFLPISSSGYGTRGWYNTNTLQLATPIEEKQILRQYRTPEEAQNHLELDENERNLFYNERKIKDNARRHGKVYLNRSPLAHPERPHRMDYKYIHRNDLRKPPNPEIPGTSSLTRDNPFRDQYFHELAVESEKAKKRRALSQAERDAYDDEEARNQRAEAEKYSEPREKFTQPTFKGMSLPELHKIRGDLERDIKNDNFRASDAPDIENMRRVLNLKIDHLEHAQSFNETTKQFAKFAPTTYGRGYSKGRRRPTEGYMDTPDIGGLSGISFKNPDLDPGLGGNFDEGLGRAEVSRAPWYENPEFTTTTPEINRFQSETQRKALQKQRRIQGLPAMPPPPPGMQPMDTSGQVLYQRGRLDAFKPKNPTTIPKPLTREQREELGHQNALSMKTPGRVTNEENRRLMTTAGGLGRGKPTGTGKKFTTAEAFMEKLRREQIEEEANRRAMMASKKPTHHRVPKAAVDFLEARAKQGEDPFGDLPENPVSLPGLGLGGTPPRHGAPGTPGRQRSVSPGYKTTLQNYIPMPGDDEETIHDKLSGLQDALRKKALPQNIHTNNAMSALKDKLASFHDDSLAQFVPLEGEDPALVDDKRRKLTLEMSMGRIPTNNASLDLRKKLENYRMRARLGPKADLPADQTIGKPNDPRLGGLANPPAPNPLPPDQRAKKADQDFTTAPPAQRPPLDLGRGAYDTASPARQPGVAPKPGAGATLPRPPQGQSVAPSLGTVPEGTVDSPVRPKPQASPAVPPSTYDTGPQTSSPSENPYDPSKLGINSSIGGGGTAGANAPKRVEPPRQEFINPNQRPPQSILDMPGMGGSRKPKLQPIPQGRPSPQDLEDFSSQFVPPSMPPKITPNTWGPTGFTPGSFTPGKELPAGTRPPITPTGYKPPAGAPPVGSLTMPPAPDPLIKPQNPLPGQQLPGNAGYDPNKPMFPPPPGAQGTGSPLPKVQYPEVPGAQPQAQPPANVGQGIIGHSESTAPSLGTPPSGGVGTPAGSPQAKPPVTPATPPPVPQGGLPQVKYPEVPKAQPAGQSVAPLPGVNPGMPQAGQGQSVAPPPGEQGYKAPEGSWEGNLMRDYHSDQPYPAPRQPRDMSNPANNPVNVSPFGEPPKWDQPRRTVGSGTGLGALNRLDSRGEANAQLGLTQGRRAVPDQDQRWEGLQNIKNVPDAPYFRRESTPEDRANEINRYISRSEKPVIDEDWRSPERGSGLNPSDRMRRANADLVAKAEDQARLAQTSALRKSGLGIGTKGSQTAEFDAYKDKQLADAVKSGRALEIEQQKADQSEQQVTLADRQQRLQELENRRKDALERRHQSITGYVEAGNLGEHGREFEKGKELEAEQFASDLALKEKSEEHGFTASKEQIDNAMENFYVNLNEKRDEFVEAQNMGRQALEDHREEAVETLAQNYNKVSGDHMISYAQLMQNRDKMEQEYAIRARELAQGKMSLDQAEQIAHRQFLVQARIQESAERIQAGEISLHQFQANVNQQLALIGYQIDTRKLQEMITARENGDEQTFISLQNQLLTEIADKNLSREALSQQRLIHQEMLQQGRENVITQMQELNRARNERTGESRAGLQERGGGKLMDNASAIRGEVSRRDETRAEGDFDRQNASVNKIYDAGMTRSESDAQRRANQAEATRATDVGVAKFRAERETGVAQRRADRLEGRISTDQAILEGRINTDLLRHETRSQLDQQLRTEYTKMFYQAENAREQADRQYAEQRMNDIYQAREKLAYREHESRERAIDWGHSAERDRAMYQAQADQQARIYMHGSESGSQRQLHNDIVKDTDDYYEDLRDEANMHYLHDQDVAKGVFGARHERALSKYGQRNARSGQVNQNEQARYAGVHGAQQTALGNIHGAEQARYANVHGAEQTRFGKIYEGRERRNLAQHGAEQDLYGNIYRGREARSAELYRGQNQRSELLYGTQQHRQDNWYGTNEGRNQSQFGAENTRDAIVFDREGRVLDNLFGSRNEEAGNIFSDEAKEHYDRINRRSQVRSEQFQQLSATNTGTFRDRSDEVSDQIKRRHEREQAALDRASRERTASMSSGGGGGGGGYTGGGRGFSKIVGYASNMVTGFVEGSKRGGVPGGLVGAGAGYLKSGGKWYI